MLDQRGEQLAPPLGKRDVMHEPERNGQAERGGVGQFGKHVAKDALSDQLDHVGFLENRVLP